MKISAVVLAKNEEENIEKCLQSVGWCDELILVDDYSKDKTVEIAKEIGAKVFKRKLENDFSAQRNFGLSKASGEWILFVDADEIVSEDLASEIKRAIKTSDVNGYLIKRVGVVEEWILRLGRKSSGKWSREVHEVWNIKGKVGKLASPLLHSPASSFKEFVAKINKYSSLHAKENQKEGKKSNLLKIIFMPFLKFISVFFLKRGYKSGLYGFIFSIFMCFHSFLSWSKLWILQNQK